MKKLFALALVLILTISTVVACGGGNNNTQNNQTGQNNQGDQNAEKQEYTFKLGHIAPESHVWHKSLLVLQEELDTRSEGRMKLELFPAASLGNESDMFQQVQAGSLEMAFLTVAELSNHSELFSSWFMPFIMEDHNDAFAVAQTEEAMSFFESLDGTQGLGYVFAGMRHVLSKEEPVTDVADVNGLSIRVTPSPAITEWWSSLGAGPTPVPLPELYTALQTGVIDAIDIDLDALVSTKVYEVGKYFTPMNHMVWPGGYLINKALWDGMTEEDQQIIKDAFEVVKDYNLEINIEAEETNLQTFIDNGGEVSELENEAPFLEKAAELHEEYSVKDEKIKAFIEQAKSLSSQ